MRILLDESIKPDQLVKIRAMGPQVDFVYAQSGADMMKLAPTVEATIACLPSDDFIRAAKKLRWIQTRGQGIDWVPFGLLMERGITLCNGRGGCSQSVAETALGHMFALAIGTGHCIEYKVQHKNAFADYNLKKIELAGKTLLHLGLGSVGSHTVAMASAIGMHVIGCRRRPLPPPPGVHEVVFRPQLHEALARADFVVMQLPLTDLTRGFLDEPELRAMKKSAYLVNTGRGKTIVREPLLRAIGEGWIAGAALDVTDPEPLQPGDPIWDLPNTILSYHLAGSSDQIENRFEQLYSENVRRFVAGEQLLNIVDLVAQY